MFEDGPSKLLGRSQEMSGNRHPQMNDRYPVLGNPNQAQNSAYRLLRPFFSESISLREAKKRTITKARNIENPKKNVSNLIFRSYFVFSYFRVFVINFE